MLSKLEGIFGTSLPASGKETRFCCPYCHSKIGKEDINFHLYVNTSNGKYFCQRCETKGHVSKMWKGEVASHKTEKKEPRALVLARLLEFGADESKEDVEESGWPDDYVPVYKFPNSQAVTYLSSRGIPFELAVERGLGFGTGKNKGRIIFPVFSNDKRRCVYWVARSYTNQDHDDVCTCWLCKRRYTNAVGKRSVYLYGLAFARGEEVCIAEGAISALSCGPNTVASFGKYVTPIQVDILCERFDRIQVALDPDAVDSSVNLMVKLLGRGKRVEYVKLPPGNDPNDLGVERMMHLRKTATPVTRSNLSAVILS
jgi:hypothetical protein